NVTNVEAELGFAGPAVRAVAGEAVLGQDRADVAAVTGRIGGGAGTCQHQAHECERLNGAMCHRPSPARTPGVRGASLGYSLARFAPGPPSRRTSLFRGLERDVLQSLQLGVDVGALVEREPPANALRLAGRAVLDHRIGVHTRARRVAPGAAAPLPAG